MMLQLREITFADFDDCVAINVRDDQRTFVDPPVYSIALSKIETRWQWQPRAVYDDEKLIGFVNFGETEAGVYYLDSVIIDARFQGRGYGRALMLLMIAHIKALSGYHTIELTHDPSNAVAARLYLSLGFIYTGKTTHDEPVMKKDLTPQPPLRNHNEGA